MVSIRTTEPRTGALQEYPKEGDDIAVVITSVIHSIEDVNAQVKLAPPITTIYIIFFSRFGKRSGSWRIVRIEERSSGRTDRTK
jgi:hypothetical protein